MLIHHLVPGQEEGNLKLLQQLGAGDLAENPKDLTEAVSTILADNATRWRRMKIALKKHDCNDGAINATKFILNEISSS